MPTTSAVDPSQVRSRPVQNSDLSQRHKRSFKPISKHLPKYLIVDLKDLNAASVQYSNEASERWEMLDALPRRSVESNFIIVAYICLQTIWVRRVECENHEVLSKPLLTIPDAPVPTVPLLAVHCPMVIGLFSDGVGASDNSNRVVRIPFQGTSDSAGIAVGIRPSRLLDG